MFSTIIRNQISLILSLAGYVFVTVVSVISALSMEDPIGKVLLIVSALVTLVLAFSRLLSAKKMLDRIKWLEDNHPSFSYNEKEEKLTVNHGIQ